MIKALLISLVLTFSFSEAASAKAACDGLKRKECVKAGDCRWQKAKKSCVQKKMKKNAKVKKKAAKKHEAEPVAKEAADDNFGTGAEGADSSMDDF